MPRAMTRRAVLGGAAVVALGGCAEPTASQIPPPKPDVAVLTGAIGAEERLIALYEAVRSANPGLAGRLDPALAHHREHLAVLRRHYLPGTGPSGATTTPVPVPRPTVPADEDHVLKLLRDAETEAAAARLADVARVAPGVAQLLAGIGACEAGHAEALARSARRG